MRHYRWKDMFSSWQLISLVVIFITNGNLGKSLDAYPDRINLPEFQRRSSDSPGSFVVNDKHKDDDDDDDDGSSDVQEPIASTTLRSSKPNIAGHPNPTSKRTIIADMDGKDHLQKVILAYGTAVATVLGYAGNPAVAVAAQAIPYFTDILVQLVKEEAESNVWTQIEERVDERISSALSEWHFGNLIYHVNILQHLMTKKDLDEDDLKYKVLSRKEQFLPQTYERVGFNTQWTTALPAFVTYMSAVYLDLIKENAIDKCSLGKELKIIREDAIEAVKALFRARYRGLIGIKHFKAWPKRRSCQGIHCFRAAWFTFKDEADGKEYSELLSDVKYYIFHTIEEHTRNLLWENMIVKLNAFFNSSLCLCEDECPDPIRKDEISFSYPTSCYGEGLDGGEPCALPCHSYDSDKEWCPTEIPPEHNNLLSTNWQDCKKERTMTKCFPVKGAKVFGG